MNRKLAVVLFLVVFMLIIGSGYFTSLFISEKQTLKNLLDNPKIAREYFVTESEGSGSSGHSSESTKTYSIRSEEVVSLQFRSEFSDIDGGRSADYSCDPITSCSCKEENWWHEYSKTGDFMGHHRNSTNLSQEECNSIVRNMNFKTQPQAIEEAKELLDGFENLPIFDIGYNIPRLDELNISENSYILKYVDTFDNQNLTCYVKAQKQDYTYISSEHVCFDKRGYLIRSGHWSGFHGEHDYWQAKIIEE